jgi:hypothetical protein
MTDDRIYRISFDRTQKKGKRGFGDLLIYDRTQITG